MPALNDAALAFYLGQAPQDAPWLGVDRSATVAITSGSLIPRNDARRKLLIVNDGANAVWVNLGATATAVAGGGNIKLAALGGKLELAGYTGAVNAIAETAPVAVTAREF
jgi:hypothetical protein